MWKPYLELPRPVYVLCLGTFLNRAGTFLLAFLTLYLSQERRLGVQLATLAMGAVGLGGLIAALLGGHLADRFGRRLIMLVSLLGGAAVLLCFGSLTSPWSILTALVVFSLISDMYRPAAAAMIADLVEPQRRAYAYGLMYVSINLGCTVAPIVGGLVAAYSYQWLFWGDALTAILYAVIIAAAIRETRPTGAALRHNVLGAEGGSRPLTREGVKGGQDSRTSEGAADVSLIAAIQWMLKDRTFVLFALGTLFMAIVFVQCFSTLPLYMAQLGHGPTRYGMVVAINGMMIVCLQLPVTAVITGFPRGTILIVAAVLNAAGFGLVGLATGIGALAVTVVVWTVAELMQSPLMSAIVSDLAPTALRARYMGVLTMCFAGAMVVGGPIGGTVLARLGGTYLWGGCLGVGLISAVLYSMVRRELTEGRGDA